jgi:flagellar assembly factor FliW
MLIHSTRLGELEVSDDMMIDFSYGVPGFPDEKTFVFLPYKEESPFAFLQSTAEPNLTFLVVDSFTFFRDYEFTLPDEIVAELGLSTDNVPQIYNIVRVPEKSEEMTANLLAPIVINMKDRKAMQIVLEMTPYSTRHRLFPDGLPKQSDKEDK